MRHTPVWFGGLIALTALGGAARAQEQSNYLTQHLRPPSNALELKVGTGYTQGFGDIAPGRALPDVGGAGVGGSADIDYRMTRRWSIGIEGQYQELTSEQNSSARGVVVNFGGTYHLAPAQRGDPWVRLGTGFRWLWENDPTGATGTTVSRYGVEAVALKIGYDVRVSEDAAIAPVLGADLTVFDWEDSTNTANHALATPQAGTFIYAGLQGRFDVGGRAEAVATMLPPVQLTAAPVPVAPSPVVETKQVAPSIRVSEEVLRACNQNLDAVDKAPKFDFDRSDLQPDDLSVLRKIGECFATGPLKGMTMVLVGRADPRGTVEYNETLGAERASNVASYLETLGVQAGQIEQTSRGKLDASGNDEATWAIDRRVDILLKP